MLKRQELTLFVIIGNTPGGDFAVPATSARVAAQVVRHLTEYCPRAQASWQVNPHAPPGPVVIIGRARVGAGDHLLDQDVHAFLLAAGNSLPPVWSALCAHQVAGAEFDALDPGMGRQCHAHWTVLHRQDTGIPVRAAGHHRYPQMRHSSLDHRLPGGGSST